MQTKALLPAVFCILLVATGCATRSDYATVALAERGNLEGALAAARQSRGGGIDGLLLGPGGSQCRAYEVVVTLLVAKGDFSGASSVCRDYDEECAVVPDSQLCFTYAKEELARASGDQRLADSLSDYARQAVHFRWLMIRDDYEGHPPRRPIY